MTQLKKAVIKVEWADPKRGTENISVQYNPTEYTLDKAVTLGEVAIPGLDAPVQQYVRGNAEKLTFDLFFDTTEQGTGPGAVSVTTETDKIYQLIRIEPERHAPPILTFIWNDKFPGSSIGGAPGASAGAAGTAITSAVAGAASTAMDSAVAATGSVGATALAAAGAAMGGQSRNGFRCVLESVKQKFTLFSPDGIPLRATLTVSLREYRTLNDQFDQISPRSPDRTHSHVVSQSDWLSSISNTYYENSDNWRVIASHSDNRIEDPRRLAIGSILTIPRLT
jgi:hypothetical protein